MAQHGWKIDSTKCVGCHSCAVACKMENNTAADVAWRVVIKQESGNYPDLARLSFSMACYHCAHPACKASCPVDAITKNEDGIVLIDQDNCIGCKYCMAACPYGAPQFNEASGKVEKCTFCSKRIAAGLVPACVKTCVGGAIEYVTDVDPGGTAPDGFADPSLTGPSVEFRG